jgi:CheY-like chemotaxis protein
MESALAPKVLIVDDDENVRDVLRLAFEMDGFAITGEAASGPEAVASAMRLEPDVVVLDYLMPGQDGATTAECLRALLSDVRIVAFSAALTSKPYWADAFLTKDRLGELTPLVHLLAPIHV